jgi:hypothetical protein
MAFAFNYATLGQVIAPFESFNETLLTEQCGEFCLPLASNYFGVSALNVPPAVAFAQDPLMTALTADSCPSGQYLLSALLYYALEPPHIVPTDLLYVALAIAPPGPLTYSNISELLYMVDNDPKSLAK